MINNSNSFQDDDDGHLIVLNIIEEIMCKTQEEFLDHFARLGVFAKVQALMDTDAEELYVQLSGSQEEPALTPRSSTSVVVTPRSTSGIFILSVKGNYELICCLSKMYFR